MTLTGVNIFFFLAGKLKKLQLVKIDQNRLLCLTPAIGGCVAYWFASLMGGAGNVWQIVSVIFFHSGRRGKNDFFIMNCIL